MFFPIALIFAFLSELVSAHYNASEPRYHNATASQDKPTLLKRSNETDHGHHGYSNSTNGSRVFKAVSQISDGQVQQATGTPLVSTAENGAAVMDTLSLGVLAPLVAIAIL